MRLHHIAGRGSTELGGLHRKLLLIEIGLRDQLGSLHYKSGRIDLPGLEHVHQELIGMIEIGIICQRILLLRAWISTSIWILERALIPSKSLSSLSLLSILVFVISRSLLLFRFDSRWNRSLAINPLPLDGVLLLHLHYLVHCGEGLVGHEPETSRFPSPLVLQDRAVLDLSKLQEKHFEVLVCQVVWQSSNENLPVLWIQCREGSDRHFLLRG